MADIEWDSDEVWDDVDPRERRYGDLPHLARRWPRGATSTETQARQTAVRDGRRQEEELILLAGAELLFGM